MIKIMKRNPYYDFELWCQGHYSNFYLIAHYFSKHSERLKKIGGIVVFDVFTFSMQPIFHLKNDDHVVQQPPSPPKFFEEPKYSYPCL